MSGQVTPESSHEAMEYLRAEAIKAANKYGITIDRLMAKLNEELEADETRVFNDKDDGIVYSEPLIAWKVRQEARRDAEAHLGIKPAEKIDHTLTGSISVMAEVVDALAKLKAEGEAKSKGKSKSKSASK